MTAPLALHQAATLRTMRLYPDCATRNDLVYLCELRGDLDVHALAEAVGDLVTRHSALRTTISADGQHVREPHGHGELTHESAESVEAVAARLAADRLGLAEVLAGAPLFRARVHEVGGRILVSLSMHHLVYDGWSLSVIWRDLAELYRARVAGVAACLPALPWSYPEFALSQRDWVPAIDYWKTATKHCPAEIGWPGLQPERGDYQVETVRVPADLTGARAMARACRVSPFTVLLAVTGKAITTVTGHLGVLLGNDDADRDQAAENVVGLFVNTRLTPVPTSSALPDLVRSVSEGWRQTCEHGRVYVDQVLDAVGCPELVKVGFAGGPGGGLKLTGVDVRPLHVPWNTRYWRNLTVSWSASYVEVSFRPSRMDSAVALAVARALGAGLP
jgi:hypothetical protein